MSLDNSPIEHKTVDHYPLRYRRFYIVDQSMNALSGKCDFKAMRITRITDRVRVFIRFFSFFFIQKSKNWIILFQMFTVV